MKETSVHIFHRESRPSYTIKDIPRERIQQIVIDNKYLGLPDDRINHIKKHFSTYENRYRLVLGDDKETHAKNKRINQTYFLLPGLEENEFFLLDVYKASLFSLPKSPKNYFLETPIEVSLKARIVSIQNLTTLSLHPESAIFIDEGVFSKMTKHSSTQQASLTV